MSKEELYDHIERYLADAMDSSERSTFEARIAAEPTLASEVALHKRMQAELGDPVKRDLREKLEKLSIAYTADEKPEEGAKVVTMARSWKRVLSIAAAVLIGGLLIWLLTQGPDKPQEIVQDPDPPKQEEEIQPQTPPIAPQEERIAQEDPPKEQDPVTPNVKPPQETPQAPDNNQLALLEPNPVFEASIGKGNLNPRFEFTVESPDPNATLTASTGNVDLAVNGMVETPFKAEEFSVSLLLFDNQAAAMTDATAIQQFAVSLEKETVEQDIAFMDWNRFFFDLNTSVKLSPGLYYYSLINPKLAQGSAERTLRVGSFIVK